MAMALALLLLGATGANAATFTVNSTGDQPDSSDEDNICFIGSGFFTCTLRAAIQEANRDPGMDTIAFEIPGNEVHKIDTALPQTIQTTRTKVARTS